jgi:hypothetical protein
VPDPDAGRGPLGEADRHGSPRLVGSPARPRAGRSARSARRRGRPTSGRAVPARAPTSTAAPRWSPSPSPSPPRRRHPAPDLAEPVRRWSSASTRPTSQARPRGGTPDRLRRCRTAPRWSTAGRWSPSTTPPARGRARPAPRGRRRPARGRPRHPRRPPHGRPRSDVTEPEPRPDLPTRRRWSSATGRPRPRPPGTAVDLDARHRGPRVAEPDTTADRRADRPDLDTGPGPRAVESHPPPSPRPRAIRPPRPAR